MDRASVLPYPSSRTLSAWWRQLQSLRPLTLWAGYCYLHRVEASVQTRSTFPLDPFAAHLLQAIALHAATPPPCQRADCVAQLVGHLHLPPPLLRQGMRDLSQARLIAFTREHGWNVTEPGQQALAQRSYVVPGEERRVFPFVEQVDETGQRTGEPSYWPLAECPATSWQTTTEEAFQPAWLRRCIDAPAEWKRGHGFPEVVAHLEDDAAAAVQGISSAAALPWQRILLDRTERTFVVLVETAGQSDGARWLGFAANGPLNRLHETVVLRQAETPLPPALMPRANDAAVESAWRDWCRQHQLAEAEVQACRLSRRRDEVLVELPRRFLPKLQATLRDYHPREPWLLCGTGHLRQALTVALAPLPGS